ncbi:tyrosine-type recombinase/integrase [Agreia sp. COWG]|uniref:tyrosine-type recombinase/integrase n=1 Tax=Agreia sp. COWG TaxID=2773266 RepID=UPI001926FAC9
MRHTAASLAASAGGNVKVLQNMLGHASAAMTLDIYSDVFDEVLEAIGVALDEARRRALVGQPTGAGKTKPPASQRLQGV